MVVIAQAPFTFRCLLCYLFGSRGFITLLPPRFTLARQGFTYTTAFSGTIALCRRMEDLVRRMADATTSECCFPCQPLQLKATVRVCAVISSGSSSSSNSGAVLKAGNSLFADDLLWQRFNLKRHQLSTVSHTFDYAMKADYRAL